MRAQLGILAAACLLNASPTGAAPVVDDNRAPEPRPGATLEESVLAMQRYCLGELGRAEALDRDPAGRGEAFRQLVEYMEGRLEVYEAQESARGVVLWLRYLLGRTRVLEGDLQGAYRDLDVVAGERTYAPTYPASLRDFVDDLRMRAFHTKAKAAFDSGDHELCIRAADEMFAAVSGYPSALSGNLGNAVKLLKVEAVYLKAEPDYALAVAECRRVIARGHGDWPDRARALLYRIHEAMEASAGRSVQLFGRWRPARPLVSDASYLRDAALGAYKLASEADTEARRSKLFYRAISLYEKTILACRKDETTCLVRLSEEPRAWFEMGICYSELGLWYESAFAFEGVLFGFSKRKVVQLLAGDPRFEATWLRFREKVNSARPGLQDRELYLAFYEEAKKGPRFAAILEEHESQLEMSARNLVRACRRRWRESRSEFDLGRCRRAEEIYVRTNPNAGGAEPVSPQAPASREEEDVFF